MTLKKPIAGFLLWFILYHCILFIMRQEHQVFWHLYTGLMLLASIGYIYYERNIESKRLLDSLITGILASFVIVMLHTLLSFILPDIRYFHILKTLVSLGVYVKWQLMITLVISIPLQELMMRILLQNELDTRFKPLVTALVVSLCATSLFVYAVNINILIFIFMTQVILAMSYQHTKRLITPMTGQIVAIILFILIYQN
ncbi:CPBP family glutamic-type intramembrane protease [Macrococcus capreoli]|uniref:CPBP family glutamic-type intramembrane protease n=1 Tax=Macrococcus capreoli TaxID=2982690 RepID=UPI003EE59238